ncbi:hypothetical protein BDN71DRAFT_1478250 [Pleurotus eryngii]|uniref:CxC2-like cysteine cluster KDZ transposase-associated domain-containing protein n=1 Tax=Pleurotus eryngii TaxID=5323 RepID=A0A9P5ZIY7_PLEER|nr:hypothetical protein BDN71DRAFT_1478250 [Pleurotus eryngii]
MDCYDESLYCKQYMVDSHARTPFHRIEHWTEARFFARVSLKALGLRIQLGHDLGRTCLNPSRAKGDAFVIIDATGIHEVGLNFCDCQTKQPMTVQLLQRGLFPSTVTNPQTAATFHLLDLFQMLSMEGQVSAFEFYKSITRLTDKTQLDPPRDRYAQFLRMSREWRHLLQLKRSARGHHPDGAEGTQPGELAVLCPACPQPGINLPNEIDGHDSWWHALFIGIDANFRLKRKNVSNDILDPGLSRGWGYFVEDTAYQAHVTSDETPIEKSSCVSHKAVNDADKRPAKGLVVNGVGTVECTRHDFKRLLSVGDLRYGERYVNMDYIFFSSIKTVASKIPRIIASYNIACQWHINLWRRMDSLPTHLQYTAAQDSITTLVPKFHLPAHISTCQSRFSFNYTLGVGRTDREAPERGWDYLNPAANQTKEMGPGSRRELLEDLMGDRNWKKTIGMGNTLLRRMKEAVPECSTHTENHRELEAQIEEATITEWRTMVEIWKSDRSKPNPYMVETTALSQDAIRLHLSDLEAATLASGTLVMLHDEMTPSMFVSTGVDLEQQQHQLLVSLRGLGQHATDHQRLAVVNRANTLRTRITNFYDVQKLYCPAAFVLVSQANSTNEASSNVTEDVARLALCLPSSFKTASGCSTELREIEWQLRYAQAHDALNDIRAGLHLRVSVFRHKDRFDRGQRALTRAMGNISRVQARIDEAIQHYCIAYAALQILSRFVQHDGIWRGELAELKSEDIRGLGVVEMDNSEGHHTISWIWRTAGVAEAAGTDTDLHSSLRLEWCKSQARALRWSEEVSLLKEEMRRVLAFLTWQAAWWEGQVGQRDLPELITEGLDAYARRQADMRIRLAASFAAKWASVPAFLSLHNPLDTAGSDSRSTDV